MSTALYRRYRPDSFADVIGQDHVTEPLMQALRTGRVNHAYLFSGPRGCGKTTSARILARCLNCEQGSTPVPCGVCESCIALARDGAGSLDVIEIDAASHGGVDDARDLRERAAYGPTQSRYKIYIIDEAHMVSKQGFNALLKIVEEPPEHVMFIFATTEPDQVIGTIRSRTHHYPFRLVPPQRLQDYLAEMCVAEKVAVAPGVLSFVVRAGGGSVRDSLSVLDQLIAGSGDEGLTYDGAAALLGFTDGEILDATIDGFTAGDAAAVFRQIDKVIETGHDPRRFVEDVLERLRDLIVVAAVPDGASSVLRGFPEDQLERMRQQSAAFGPGSLSRSADIVNAGLTEMTGTTAPRLQLELICARVLLPGASGESGYAARLDRLERRLEMTGAPAPAGSGASRNMGPVAPVSPPVTQVTQPALSTAPARRVPGSEPEPVREAVPAPGPSSQVEPGPTPATSGVGASAAAATGDGATAAGSGRRPATSGGIDTDAIRRSWPDVLAKIFTIRRATWTFLSEHTQVLDYDGKRLLLGIQTEGLANTFSRGQHAELVRQALSEVLGVEAFVEGIPTPASTRPSASARASAPPAAEPDQPSGASGASGALGPGPSDTREPSSRAARQRDPEPRDGWNTSSPPPEWASPATSAATVTTTSASGAAPGTPSTPMQRARAAVAREASSRHTGSGSGSLDADDSVVSADDEDIEDAGAVGLPVIERVLGGIVIGELDQ